MKFTFTSLAAVAALALGSTAMAGNVYISGSTAYRTAILTQIGTSGAVFDGAATEAYAGSSATGATYANFTGLVGGVSTTIKCSFTGSAGGIYLIAHNGDATPPKAIFLADGASGSGLANPTAGTGDVHKVDIALSDAFQSSSSFTSPTVGNDDQIGIVTFKWVGNYSLAQNSAGGTSITNLTSQGAKALFSGAFLESAAQLTGSVVAADQSIYVFAFGRDFDSGTRITAFADSGNGSTTSPYQWQPFMSPTTGAYVGTPAAAGDTAAQTDTAITQLQQWNNSATYTLYNNTLSVVKGDGGFNSGGNLAKVMRSDSNTSVPAYFNAHLKTVTGYSQNCTGAYIITYLGISDAATALAAPTGSTFGLGAGRELTYNGVTYSTTAIQQGQYSFWGYEHMMYNSLSGAASTVQSRLEARFTGDIADVSAVGLYLDSMAVGRLGDGQPILALYY
jgi:hypothetical protein